MTEILKTTITVPCDVCEGTGNQRDLPMYACLSCGGQGHVDIDPPVTTHNAALEGDDEPRSRAIV
jgi:DnaJ-class molecular chaperone